MTCRRGSWWGAVAVLLLVCLTGAPARAQNAVPRVIVALYDGRNDDYVYTRLHRPAEMPLNHLGLIVIPFDVSKGLPPDSLMRDARGIITWFSSEPIKDPAAYLAWLDHQTADGKRFVLIGDLGFPADALDALALRARFDRIMGRIGVVWRGSWVSLTYAKRIVAKDAAMVEFERPYPKLLPPYAHTEKTPDARAYLSVARTGQHGRDDLVVIGRNGGYIAAGYAALLHDTTPIVRAWYVNPFRFFRAAFATDDLPKLDTTTMSGRRVFYSHIDGDALQNIASLERYSSHKVMSAEVVYEQILRKYPGLPVTVAPISGDLDPAWYGTREAREIVRRIMALPNVEAGSHTFSHPFAWGFFHPYDASREAPYLCLYPPRPDRTLTQSVFDPKAARTWASHPPKPIDGVYTRPRSYAVKPFDLALEIEGSVRVIKQLLPPDKRVMILQWSGDTMPWAKAIAKTRKDGLRNINGGDSRMDGDFDSYAWLSPIGRRVGDQWQIYSSAANENIYTDDWHRRFYAFRGLINSIKNTEAPIRVKPIDVYYHFYSAERPEGLNAVRAILDYVRTRSIAPIATSRFAAMADGFLNARIVALGGRQWRIENRDGIETVRFDNATLEAVDFAKSVGVIGQRHFQGSLYVALDSTVAAPIVALKGYSEPWRDPDAAQPYLVELRWRVKNFGRNGNEWRFDTEGFGPGEFDWRVPDPGVYRVAYGSNGSTVTVTVGPDRHLRFAVPADGEAGIEISRAPRGRDAVKTNYYIATLVLVAGGFGLGTYLVPRGGELAMIYYRGGRLNEARKLLESEMDRGDLSPSNVHYATQTYLRLGDVDRAIALVERYVDANPDDVRARRILGRFYRDTGRRALYIANLEEIERLAPSRSQRIELATLYRAAGQYGNWMKMLQRLVAENGASAEDHYDLARLDAASEKRAAALSVLDLLEKRFPRAVSLGAYQLRIALELDQHHPDRALAWAEKGVKRIPGAATALSFVALFQRRGRPKLALAILEPFGDSPDASLELLRTLIALEIANGKAARALQRLEALDAAGKLKGADRNLLIVAAVMAGKWDDAKAAFEATAFDDVSEEALDRLSSAAIARNDRAAIRMILSRATPQFLEANPITAARLYLMLRDPENAARWADKAFNNKDLSDAERVDLATLYVQLGNRDRARALLKALTVNPGQIRDMAIDLASLYLKLDLADDGFALMDRIAKREAGPKVLAARALLDAKLRPKARDWDLGWAKLGPGAAAGAADLVNAAYWAAMDAQLYPLGAALGQRLFEASPSNDTRLRYGRALALAGNTEEAVKVLHPMLAESADARSAYSLALIAAVKAGTARRETVKNFIAKQLEDPAMSLADKKSLISELIEAKAYDIVLPLLEELMRGGNRSAYVELYVWALTSIRDKKRLRALLQRELPHTEDPTKRRALAKVAFDESWYDLARPAYLAMLKANPKDLDALKRLGEMAAWSGNAEQGRRYLTAFVANGGDDYHADYTLGETIIQFPDWQRATPHYQRAFNKINKLKNPTLDDLMLRAKILYRLGRFDASVAAYETLLRRYPRDRALRNEFFDVLSEMGRYERARQLRGVGVGR